MRGYLLSWLVIAIMICPAFCKEVAYVYEDSFQRPLEVGNITDYRGDDAIGSLKDEIRQKVDVDNQRVKDKANRLVLDFPGDREIQQVCSIYDYLAGKWSFRSDLRGLEDIQYASYTLQLVEGFNYSGQGDCDDFAVIMAALTERIGGTSRLILAYGDEEGHAYAEVYLGKAGEPDGNVDRIFKWIRWKYKTNRIYYHMDEDGDVWLNLDWWKEPGGSKHPGGPIYGAKNHLPISIAEVPKKPLNPSNLPPTVENFFPDKSSPLIPGSDVTFNALSLDPEDDNISYRYYLNGKSKTVWMKGRINWSWSAEEADVGPNEIEVRVRDGYHANEEGYDDKRSVRFDILPATNPLRMKSTDSFGDFFTWNPENFAGFYYDIDRDLGTENLTINRSEDYKLSGRPPYGIIYTTKAQNKEFEYGEWGSYKIIGFLTDRYFAGYNHGDNEISNLFCRESTDVNSLERQQLEKVLFDDNTERTISSGYPLKLGEGYELTIKSIDIDGNKVYLELSKEGWIVDSNVLCPSCADEKTLVSLKRGKDTFIFAKNIAKDKEVEVIKVHFRNAFRGADTSLATVDGIWQASESDPSQVIINSSDKKILSSGTPLQLGEGYELAIKSIDVDGNKVYLELSKDGLVVDSKVITTSTTPPTAEDETFVYARDVGTPEEVEVIKVHFRNAFRGADTNLATVDGIWQASESDPSQVIINSSNRKILSSGKPLQLEEGYELAIKSIDIDGNKVYLELSKDGLFVDSKVIITPKVPPTTEDETFVYARDVGTPEEVEVIKVHFRNAFRGAETNLATLDSIWQASESDPSQVIMNSSDKKILSSGTPLQLGEGYELAIKSIDIDGNKVYLELSKDGSVVDSKVIITPKVPPTTKDETFVYARDVGTPEEVEVIKVHFRNAFRGADTSLATVDGIWQASESDPSQVIMNISDKKILSSGTSLQLEEGYELAIKSIDVDGRKVYLELTKDGLVVDSAMVTPPTKRDKTFVYAMNVGDQKNLVTIAVHFKNAFRGAEVDLATIDGVWQLSEYPIEVQVDTVYDKMSIANVTSDTITLDNRYNPLILLGNQDYPLMGGLRLATADEELLEVDTSSSCSLLKEFTEPGTYTIRGQVATGDFEWNSQNFAGFLCDNDPNFGTEKIITKLTEDNMLQEHEGVVYSTAGRNKMFQFHSWGSYRAIGYLGHKYFAGYIEDPNIDDDNEILLKNSLYENALAYKQLVEILKDDATENTISSGNYLELAEDYELLIKSIEADGKVTIELYRDKDLKDIAIIAPSKDGAVMSDKTYYYKSKVGAQPGLVILAVHFKKALRSGDKDLAVIDGVWQISDTPTVEFKDDMEYDKMTVYTIDPIKGEIIMNNNDNEITLSKNKDIVLMGDIRIRTADNDTLRYYIYKEVTIEESATPPSLVPAERLPPANATSEVTSSANLTPDNQTFKEARESAGIGRGTIWREGISSNEYLWTAQNFSGFFYDLNNDVGTEELKVNLRSGRSIDSGGLIYRTRAEDAGFEFSEWGEYQVIGFMGDKYFAGYKANDLFDERSLIEDGQLGRVLLDSDNDATITTGPILPLKDGYELRIKQIDIDRNRVSLALAKNGSEIDSEVISPGDINNSTYQYKVNISGEDTPLIMAHISNVFAGAESALVTVDGLFQISDTYASVENGDRYDKMMVESVDDKSIIMENEDSITLRRGSTTKIFGSVAFLVADADELRFKPIIERTGTYTVRGSIINPSKTKEFTWNPDNFDGFYYDIDEDVGTEVLIVKISDATRIEENDLIYITKALPISFEFGGWGKYDTIGFMAEKCFAGYSADTNFANPVSIINDGQLRKVLVDDDEAKTIASGSVLALEEGYELRIKQVDLDGNKVYLGLAKDGEEVDSKVVTPSSDAADKASNYVYEVDIGGEDIPIIIAHIQSVFRGTESDLATVDGLFQLSDSPGLVEEGDIYGKMKVESLSENGIIMRNEGSISLSRGKIIEIMENIKIEVADSDKRLLAPIAIKTG